jgi:hypothetical protein
MTISIEFVTTVIRIESINKKYPGGIDAFLKKYSVGRSYRDPFIVGVSYMGTGDVEEFIGEMVNLGFSHLVNNECDEIAILDQYEGLFDPCPWLETSIMPMFSDGKDSSKIIKKSTCWLKGCGGKDIVVSKNRS